MARRIVAFLLLVVATVLTPIAVTSLWAQRTITDTQVFNETLAPLVDDPQVRATVASEVSTSLVDAVDAKTRLSQAAANLNGPVASLLDSPLILNSIASGINGAIESGVQNYVNSDRFGTVWTAMTDELHQQFVALLNRDTSNAAITLQDGQIVLDTKVAVQKVQAELVERGVPFADQLDRIPGREVVLADTPRLQTAADTLHIFLPVASWLWLVVLLMFAGAALLWQRRSRGLMWAGSGLALGGAVTLVALNLGTRYLDTRVPAEYAAVTQSLTSLLLRFLVNALWVTVALGVMVLLAGWLAGGAKTGRRVRHMVTGPIQRWSAPLADTALGRFTAEHPMLVPTLRALVVALGIGVLFASPRLTPSQVLWTAVGVGVGMLLVEVVEGAGLGRDAGRAGAVHADASGDVDLGRGDLTQQAPEPPVDTLGPAASGT